MSVIETLRAENSELTRQLAIARAWMQREVQSQAHAVAKRRALGMSAGDRAEWTETQQEILITERIKSYFGEVLLMNAPRDSVKHITDAETSHYLLQRNPRLDGFLVIGSYQKVIDSAIEWAVTRDWRKYAQKHRPRSFDGSDPLEKSLVLIVDKKFLLSTGRLYALIKACREGLPLKDFGEAFRSWLVRQENLRNILLSDEFYLPFSALVESGTLSDKRHSGILSPEETRQARDWIVGDFKSHSSVLYQLFRAAGYL